MAVLLQKCPQGLVSGHLAWPGSLGNSEDAGQRLGQRLGLGGHFTDSTYLLPTLFCHSLLLLPLMVCRED
jgi:hypothetical protein